MEKSSTQRSWNTLSQAVLTLFFIALSLASLSAQVVVTTSASCTDGAGMNAAENAYYITVSDVTNDTATLVTDFSVEVNGDIQTFAPGDGPLTFGPFTHSGVGGAVQVVDVTDNTNGGEATREEVPEVLCGVRPDGGQSSGGFCMTTTDPDALTGSILAQSAPGTFMAGGTSGQIQTYVLVDAAGFIVQTNLTGLFTGLPSDTFQVFAVNYRDTEPVDDFLIPGESFQEVLDGLPGDADDSQLDGACYTVCNTDPVIMVPVNCLSIGSTVFTDIDNDATYEPSDGEMGIPNVSLTLLTETTPGSGVFDSIVAMTMTDASGDYFFGGLDEGNYQISIPTTPDGFPLSSTNNVPPVDATGDDMDSGIQTATGDPVTSPVIMLMAQMEPTGAEEAGQGGMQDDNTTDITQNDGDVVASSTNTSDDDANGDMTVDFGFVPSMSLGSTVFYDVDNSGDQSLSDPLEGGIGGLTVNLYTTSILSGMIDSLIDMTTTDVNGDYLFDSLPPGMYIVGVVAGAEAPVSSSGAAVSTDSEDNTDGNSDGSATTAAGDESLSGPVTLVYNMEPDATVETFQGGGQDDGDELNGNMTVDFGFVPTNSVGSTVFFDMNNDGMQEGDSEVGISGLTIQLYADLDGDGTAETLVDETMTNAIGDYFFGNLPNGDYQVVIPGAPGAANVPSTPVDATDMDPALQNGTLDGITGAVSSTVFNLMAGAETFDDPTNEQGDAQDTDMGFPEDNGNMTIDFGFIPMLSLGSTVFYDVDDSGDQDPDDPLESGIEGVTVNLYFDSNGDGAIDGDEATMPIDMVITDASGNYLFDSLPAGNYIVGVVPADDAETASSTQSVADDDIDGTNDGAQMAVAGESLSGIVMLSPGDEPADDEETFQGNTQDDGANEENGNMTVDFGFIPLGSVGSTVFFDMNDNGEQDEANDVGIEGVIVQLFVDTDGDGIPETLVGETLTDM
ncbi:MAG: SdrD B-like domain-containing protein, partial [Lewinella sp.]